MGIRKATLADGEALVGLLEQLDYGDTAGFMAEKLQTLLNHPDEELLVHEEAGKVNAFISIHFIPQIALRGDFARISYFSVDEPARRRGLGKRLEEHCVQLARQRGCDRIEVHSHARRTEAHRFYFRRGYVESPKYLIKKL